MDKVINYLNNNTFLLWYLIIINVIAFFTYGIDKLLAMGKYSRVRESTLILLSLIGGSVGAYLGMKVFHHKTLKLLFRISLPTILIIHIVLLFIMSNS